MKKIKVYSQSELDRIRPLLSEAEMMLQSTGGTIECFTIFEFVDMLCDHSWQNGIVNGIGYIPANMFQEVETGNSDIRRFTAVLGSSSSSFDFDSYWASFYSMLERNLYNDISNLLQGNTEPNNGNNNPNNGNNNPNTQNEAISSLFEVGYKSDYVSLIDDYFRVMLQYGIARTSHQLSFRYKTLPSPDNFIYRDIDLTLRIQGYGINTTERVLSSISRYVDLQQSEVTSSATFYVDKDDQIQLYLIVDSGSYYREILIYQ